MFLDELAIQWRDLRVSLEASVRVLVVDDEAAVRLTLEEALSEEGWAVETTDSVDDAWERLSTGEYSLVVVDKNLQGASGLDLLQRMLREGLATPAVVITGFPSVQTVAAAMDFGAEDYLVKPFEDISQVQRRIRGVIERGLYETFYRRVAEDLAHVLEGGSSDIISVERIGQALGAFKKHLSERTAALVLEKRAGLAELSCDALGAAGLKAEAAASADAVRSRVSGEDHPLTLVVNLEADGALDLIGELRRIDPLLEVVAVASGGSLEETFAAFEAGASDFYFRSREAPEVLQARVKRAAARSRRQRLHLHLVWTLYSAAQALGHRSAENLFAGLPEPHQRYLQVRYLGASPETAASTPLPPPRRRPAQTAGRPERRRSRRQPVEVAALYRPAHDPFAISAGRILNVSKGGVFLQMDDPLPRGTRVSIEVLQELAGPGKRLAFSGEVVRLVKFDPDPDERSGVGIRFTDMDPEVVGELVATMARAANPDGSGDS